MIRSTRRPHTPTVFRDPGREFARPVDWSGWYLTDEEDEGETPDQHEAIEWLTSVLRELGRERNWGDGVYVGGDAFFAWIPEHPLVRVSPDVYLLVDPPPPPLPSSWQTWLPGHRPPLLAVETVSGDWKKDYDEAPEKYAQLGAEELVIFDPGAPAGGKSGRIALQIYRRTDDGLFVLTYSGPGPGPVHTLRLFAVVWSGASGPRLRLARDAMGTDLIPTTEEARQRAEEAREKAEEALASERAARIALEQELDRLRKRPSGGE